MALHMTWRFWNAKESFHLFQELWDRGNSLGCNSILLDSLFVSLLIKYFGDSSIQLGVLGDKSLPSMILVRPSGKGLWETFQPSQAPLGLLILGNSENPIIQIKMLLKSLPHYALAIHISSQDSENSPLAISNNSSLIERADYMKTGRLTISGNFEDYWDKRSKDLKGNIDRRLRGLEKNQIVIEFQRIQAKDKMGYCIQEFSRLEAKGWKGAAGSAISFENSQGPFYQEVLEAYADTGEAMVFELRFNGEVVASQLALQREQSLIFLKMTYDEDYKRFSPGYILRKFIIEQVYIEAEILNIEFYGHLREGWSEKWTNEFRPFFNLTLIRNYPIGLISKIRKFIKNNS